jgi:hypothetical protein
LVFEEQGEPRRRQNRGYGNAALEILRYSDSKECDLKILFVDEGPGLLLGSNWEDYSGLEGIDKGSLYPPSKCWTACHGGMDPRVGEYHFERTPAESNKCTH